MRVLSDRSVFAFLCRAWNCGRIGFNLLVVIFLGHCLQRRPEDTINILFIRLNQIHHTYIRLLTF